MQTITNNNMVNVVLAETDYPFSLTKERERELFLKYCSEDCVDSCSELIMAHEPLVRSLARKYRNSQIDEKDLCQEGMVGLKKALDKFSPEAKNRFNTFARHYVRSEILEFLITNSSIVKLATTKAQRKLYFNSSRLDPLMSLGEMESLADDLNVKVSDVMEMSSRLFVYNESLDSEDESLWDSSLHIADVSETIAEDSEQAYRAKKLSESLDTLPARERDIVESRWLNETKTELSVLAKKYGISSEGVRVAEKKAIKLLRSEMIN
ncbi:sigma-70 family RNA polymerase sigma factor [Vibrio harveyi]|uniref:sigma-70 family RNA polymerase sigma factor n=1 Tax=Vibrio harveyi TaxID=669 RepID=UPI003CE816E9